MITHKYVEVSPHQYSWPGRKKSVKPRIMIAETYNSFKCYGPPHIYSKTVTTVMRFLCLFSLTVSIYEQNRLTDRRTGNG